MNNLQNEPLAELNTDDEVEKYSYAAAVRELGHEPFPVVAADAGGLRLPQTDADEYFAALAEATRQFGDVAAETGRGAVAGVRQSGQQLIDTGIDWFGMQMKEFYKVNGFASDEQVDAILPESMLQHLNDKGINTELPLKHIAPNTELGITARELTAYATGFLMTMGRGQAKQAGESVIDYLGRHSHNLLRAIRGNTGGAMALNVEEANLSDLALELGFDEELRAYFAEGSVADTAAEGVADELAIRANPKLEDGTQLTAEGRLARKLDQVLEDNAIGAMFGAAIMTAAKGFKLAKAAPKTTALGTGALVAGASSDAESSPASKIGANIVEGATDAARAAAKQFDTDYLGFYSKAVEVAKNLPQNKATPDQYLRMLEKQGVSKDELYWTGLGDYFSGNKSMTKDELVSYLESNRVELDEVRFASTGDVPESLQFRSGDPIIDDDYIAFLADDKADNLFVQEVDDFTDYLVSIGVSPENSAASRYKRYEADFRAAADENDQINLRNLPDDTKQYVLDWVEQMAREQAEAAPTYRYTINDDAYNRGAELPPFEIIGDDMDGYRLIDTDTNKIIGDDMNMSFEDAVMAAEREAQDRGMLNDMPAQYEKWTEPGGSNYQEFVLTLPNFKGDPSIVGMNRGTFGSGYSASDKYIEEAANFLGFDSNRYFELRNKVNSSQTRWTSDISVARQNSEVMQSAPNLTEAEMREYFRYAEQLNLLTDNQRNLRSFEDSHHSEYESNVVAHFRTKDRLTPDGKKILHIQEAQSDWAQKGGEIQYNETPNAPRYSSFAMSKFDTPGINETPDTAIDELTNLRVQLEMTMRNESKLQTYIVLDELGELPKNVGRYWEDFFDQSALEAPLGKKVGPSWWDNVDNRKRAVERYMSAVADDKRAKRREIQNIRNQLGNDYVYPRAPFVYSRQTGKENTGAWTQLVLKRALMYAAENGYDGIAIARGKPNADLYSLRQYFSKVEVEKLPDTLDKDGKPMYSLKAFDVNRRDSEVYSRSAITEAELPDFVGQQLAVEAIEKGGKSVFEGDSLLGAGGEGMIKFYDNIMPASLSKVLSKLDKNAKRETVMTRRLNYAANETGYMFKDGDREKLKKGMPLFLPPAIAVGAGAMSDKANQQANTAQMEMQF